MMCSLIARDVFDVKVIAYVQLELPQKIYEEFKSLLFVLEYIKQKLIQNKVALKLVKKLLKYGIMTRPFFWPMHEQDIFKKMKLFKKLKFPNSSYLSRYGLYLPSYYSLKSKQIDYISSVVNNILK